MAENKKMSEAGATKVSLYFNFPSISLLIEDSHFKLETTLDYNSMRQSSAYNPIYLNWFLTKDLNPNFKWLPKEGLIDFIITEEDNPKLYKILQLKNHGQLFDLLIKDYFSSFHGFNYFTNKIKTKDDSIKIVSALKYN